MVSFLYDKTIFVARRQIMCLMPLEVMGLIGALSLQPLKECTFKFGCTTTNKV
jgi:hypothetical protein